MLFESKTVDYHLCSSLKLNGELCGRLAGLQKELFWHWQNVATGENLQLLCSMVVKVEFSARFGKRFRAFCFINYQPKKPKPSLFVAIRQPHWSDSFSFLKNLLVRAIRIYTYVYVYVCIYNWVLSAYVSHLFFLHRGLCCGIFISFPIPYYFSL